MAAMEASVLYQGVAKESLAFRLMTQMGWEEGTGLGKNKQGIKSHVRVRQRKDNSGVGTDEQKKAAANWTVNTHIFDNILKNLKVKAAEPEPKKESSDEDSSDDDSVEAAPVVKKVARPQGRYKRREGGKLVKGYSATDLNAILGGEKPEADKLPQAPKIVVQEAETKASVESRKEASKEESVFVEMECEENVSQLQELAADWWGTKYGFVRGGALGSKQVQVRETVNGERPSENGRTQFSEQDQENLYNMVNDKATSGKKGLGQGERALKIGGVKVATRPGQKKVFASMEESDGEDDAQEEAATNDDSQGMNENKSAKKRKTDETVSGNEAAPLQEAPSKMKLKELVSQLLMEAPEQRMSLKRLQKRVTASTGLFSSKGDADAFRDKLLKSSKFVVEGKKVFLKSRT